MTLSDSQIRVLNGINITVSSISMTCSLFIIVCYFMFKNLRTFAMRMVLYISICDVLFSIGHFLGDLPDGPACHFQSYLISFFEIASMFWVVMIARTLQRVFLMGETDVEKYEQQYHAFCWGFALVLVLLPETTSSYGPSGAFCWIKNDTSGTTWRFLQFYVWLWTSIIFIVWVYYRIQRHYSSIEDQSSQDASTAARQKMMQRMKLYPATLIICYFFATINRLYSIFSPEPNFTLFVLHTIFASSKGFFNSMIYGFSGNIGNELTVRCITCMQDCGCCRQYSTEGRESLGAGGERA
eukprot:TRINITY_DN4247_c0_g1_i3.p1 TRINITY_DN4247_c0_g1~~TRINITY_DN4247_c0_g1_i3.p1  ORF type:complete len:297 (-),score=46.43 TRINITY_DN4247_c0_g1_i3:43-933(-)